MPATSAGRQPFPFVDQPEFELKSLELLPALQLSICQELSLGLTWSTLQYGRISADIGITVHTAEDIIECMQPRQKPTLQSQTLPSAWRDERRRGPPRSSARTIYA
jgi:hypothetical protein